MNKTAISPENYYLKILRAVQSARTTSGHFREQDPDTLKIKDYLAVKKWIAFYAGEFNLSMQFILMSIGLKYSFHNKSLLPGIEANGVCNEAEVISQLTSNRELYISRVKNLTTYASPGEAKKWITALKRFTSNAAAVSKHRQPPRYKTSY